MRDMGRRASNHPLRLQEPSAYRSRHPKCARSQQHQRRRLRRHGGSDRRGCGGGRGDDEIVAAVQSVNRAAGQAGIRGRVRVGRVEQESAPGRRRAGVIERYGIMGAPVIQLLKTEIGVGSCYVGAEGIGDVLHGW